MQEIFTLQLTFPLLMKIGLTLYYTEIYSFDQKCLSLQMEKATDAKI